MHLLFEVQNNNWRVFRHAKIRKAAGAVHFTVTENKTMFKYCLHYWRSDIGTTSKGPTGWTNELFINSPCHFFPKVIALPALFVASPFNKAREGP